MKTCILLLCIALTIIACSKETTQPSEPWNVINLTASVSKEAVLPGSERWKTSVTFDKEIYDSIFVEVQWNVFVAPSTYITTIKDTVKIAPQKAGTFHKLSNSPCEPAWTAQSFKIAYARSTVWNKYQFKY